MNEASRPSPIRATDADLPDELRSVFRAPPDARVLALADAPHAPQRTHPEALLVALLRALHD